MRASNPVVAAVFSLFCLVCAHAAVPPEVELITDTEGLQPNSTFEVRFARPMISADEVGSEPKVSPLVIEPSIKGAFTWLSSRSGVFVPDEMPRLGTEYVLTLRDGLKAADGTLVGAGFRQTIATPAFGITQERNGVYDKENIPVEPEVKLTFNLGIDLAGAEKLFAFVNSDGHRIAAKVRYATNHDYFPVQITDDDWAKRWREAAEPVAKGAPDDDEEREETFTNRLIVTADAPLTPGGTWRLEIAPGLKALEGGYAIDGEKAVELGAVAAFDLRGISPTNFINTGRSVTLEFSQPLAPDIVAETAAKFFTVTPAVKNLRFEESWSSLVVRGDFELGTEYTLVVAPDVVSAQGLPFAGERERTFSFQPVAPRLYLPEITGHQMEYGARRFDVLSVNLKSLRVVARRVRPVDVTAAIEAFAGYDRPWEPNGPENEPYQPLPAEAIPGEVIAEKTIDLAEVKVDERRETALDWTEVLGGEVAGTIFLTVEGEPMDGIGGPVKPGAQALMQITDLGVLWKKTGTQLRVDVFSMKSGDPQKGAEVALLDGARAELSRGTTNGDGFVAVEGKAGVKWLVVTSGEDIHAVRLGDGAVELPMGAFGIPVYYRGWNAPPSEGQPHRALLFTDRPLYRPGETVRVKGIVRRVDGDGLEIVKNRTATLKIRDAQWEDVDEIEVRTDERGSFDTEIAIGDSAPGRYSLALELGDDGSFSESFLVANYQPNAFELDLTMPGRLAPGVAVDAKVTAKYFFGAPLVDANAKWTLRVARTTFAPEGFDTFLFGFDEDEPDRNVLTLRGEKTFEGAAGFRIAPELPEPVGAPSSGVLTVEVTDINQQTVTDTRTFTRDASDFYLGISLPGSSVFRAGEPVAVRAVAVQANGEPVAEPVRVKAELVLRRFDTVRVKGAGDAVSFRTETSDETVESVEGATLIPTREGANWVLRDGESVRFTPKEAGQYRVRVSATDKGGNHVLSEYALHVAGPDAIAWDYRHPSQVDLVPDKTDYRPGDTARVLVKTPIAGDAMVTVERGDRVLRSFRAKLEGNSPVIDVPIKAGDGPNVFVSMVVVRGADASKRKHPMPEYRYGVCQLNVGDPMTRLGVEVRPERAEVEPGEEMAVNLVVTDANGSPVSNASVTFFAIDDGVVSITGYERPKPGRIFDEPIPLAVRTGLTLFQLMPEDPADLEFGNKGYLIGGGGMDGPGLKIRKDFPGTACWFPSLLTGQDGTVAVKFAAPDAITRYRLVAVAQAGANQFGSAESAFAIRKPLMLMPALGQFANVGDRLIARAVVRNDTGVDGTAEVALKLDATAEAEGATTASVALKNGEAAAVDFPVIFREMGEAKWTWSATMGDSRDDVVSTLKVGTPMLVLRETILSALDAKTNDLREGVNPQLLEGTGSADVTVSNTRLSSLRASVEYLRDYEYRCAEQTTSRLVPWVAMPALRPFLGDLDLDEGELAASVDRIFSMQTASGGLAFWPGRPEVNDFVSAYAAMMVLKLHPDEAERPVEMDGVLEYLSGSLRGLAEDRTDMALGDRALALYALALAGRQEPAYNEALYQRRAELSHESRALLALAILHSGGSNEVVDDLLNPKVVAPQGESWFGSASRDRAIQLLAWVRRDPKSPEVARLVKELLGYRTNGRWATTQDNAWALLALAEYAAAVEKGGATVKGAIVVNGGSTAFEVTRKVPSKSVSVEFDPAKPVEKLMVTNPKQGTLFGESRFVVYPPVGEQPRQDRGYSVSRGYRKIDDDGKLTDVDDLRVGDRVLVTLRVESARPGHFVAIDDPLPAILEAVNPEFRSAAVGGAESLATTSDHQEMREDRVVYFCDRLPAGAHTFQYLARVRTAGAAMAGATKAEEMYRPERFGLGETRRISSREAQ